MIHITNAVRSNDPVTRLEKGPALVTLLKSHMLNVPRHTPDTDDSSVRQPPSQFESRQLPDERRERDELDAAAIELTLHFAHDTPPPPEQEAGAFSYTPYKHQAR